MVNEAPNTVLQEQLKDNFDFNQHKLTEESQRMEETKSSHKNKSVDDEANGFFDTIKTSTQITKEQKHV